MVNHYVYRTINEINNMKYIGKRTCYCAIEDDMYLGSGTFIKLAIDRYGEYYFSKEILCICDTEEEAWEKEIEMIKAFDAVNSREYYNVAYGGPSRPDGFIMTNEERNKMGYLTNQLENEVYYGVKIVDRKPGKPGKPRIQTAKTMFINEKKGWCYTTIADDTETFKNDKKNKDSNKVAKITRETWYEPFKYDNETEWLQEDGKGEYTLTSKDDYYRFTCVDWDVFDETVKEIRELRRKYKQSIQNGKDNYAPINSVNVVNKKDIVSSSTTSMDSIRLLAKKSVDYYNFNNLLDEYENDLGLIAVYNAVTGSGSVSTPCLSDGSLKCTEEQMKKATGILDYELQFSDMVQAIKGRHDYLYVALAFCYNNKNINNDELFRRFSKKYKTFKTIKSIENAIDQIDGLYNFRMIKYPKVPLKQEYLTYKLNK